MTKREWDEVLEAYWAYLDAEEIDEVVLRDLEEAQEWDHEEQWRLHLPTLSTRQLISSQADGEAVGEEEEGLVISDD